MEELTGQQGQPRGENTPIAEAQNRQQDLEQMVQDAFFKNPTLRQALEIFQMSQAEYSRALIGMNNVKFITSDSTNLQIEDGGIDSAIMD